MDRALGGFSQVCAAPLTGKVSLDCLVAPGTLRPLLPPTPLAMLLPPPPPPLPAPSLPRLLAWAPTASLSAARTAPPTRPLLPPWPPAAGSRVPLVVAARVGAPAAPTAGPAAAERRSRAAGRLPSSSDELMSEMSSSGSGPLPRLRRLGGGIAARGGAPSASAFALGAAQRARRCRPMHPMLLCV